MVPSFMRVSVFVSAGSAGRLVGPQIRQSVPPAQLTPDALVFVQIPLGGLITVALR